MTRRPLALPVALLPVALLLVLGAACGSASSAGSGDGTPDGEGVGQVVLTTTTTPGTSLRATTPAPAQPATTTAAPSSSTPVTTPTTPSTVAADAVPTTVPSTSVAPAFPPESLAPPTTTPPPRTACTRVLHVGDSTTVGAISADHVPDPQRRLDAQYRRVGVRDVAIDASPGRSVVERLGGAANAHDVALDARASGYRGCWVVAIGTNDAANIAAGANLGAAARIDRVMSAVDGDPVLWVDAVTFTDEGAWARANMAAWNVELRDAMRRHPNLRVYEWSRVARADWFTSDGVHDNAVGATYRAALFADALAATFPDDQRGD